MPFTSKQKADYVELINEYLYKIPLKNENDFDQVIKDLQKIIYSDDSASISFHPDFQNHMLFVLDALKEPSMYGVLPSDYPEYQQIIRERIVSTINEFESYSAQQKQQYVVDQQRKRDEAAEHHAVMDAGESRRLRDFIEAEERELIPIHQNGISGGGMPILPIFTILRIVAERQPALFPFLAENLRSENTRSQSVSESGLFAQHINRGTIHYYNNETIAYMRNGITIIGDLQFRITALPVPSPHNGETHCLSTVVGGHEANHVMLRGEHVDLIMDNIHNIERLKEIFRNNIPGRTAETIVNIIINSQQHAENSGMRIRVDDLD